MNHLNIKAFAMSTGILYAVFAGIVHVMVLNGALSQEIYTLISEFHIFKVVSPFGVLLTALEHFFWGGLTGALFAFIYNKLS